MALIKNCNDCLHRKERLCMHRLAEHRWGSLSGMSNFMTKEGYRRWPLAEKACGYFSPTQEFIEASDRAALPAPKAVKKKAA